MARNFVVREDLLAATIQYLSYRPFQEVAQLIAGLQAATPTEAAVEKGAQPPKAGDNA